MGSELLTEEEVNEGGSEESESPFLIVKLFDDCFPYYLSIGMTEEEYWDGNPNLVRAFRKAEDIRAHRRNTEMWLNGQYIYDTLCRMLPSLNMWKPKKPMAYVEEPYPLSKTEIKERKLRDEKKTQEKIRNKMIDMMNRMRKKGKKEEQKDG